jgi:UDP-galactopyranose mutase
MPTVTLDTAKQGSSLLNDPRPYDYLIVGAGFAGAVIAERLAEGLGKHVLVIDRREHIAGNAYDHLDAAGVMVHRYGPHIFHTNAQRIVDYLSRFTEWRPYEHRVLAQVDEHLLPIPINLTTLNGLFGLSMDQQQAEVFLQQRAEPVANIRTSEDVVINQIGRELYEKFFRGYTRKQWGLDPSELDKSVTSRIPTRTNEDDRYFTDSFQAMPLHGYTRMFEQILDHPRIDVLLGTDFDAVRDQVNFKQLIYCGPIDEYFDFCFGRLPYRCLQFQHETLPQVQFQPVSVVNYPDQSVPYTRITEYTHLTGQTHPLTSISYEFPCAEGDPYYPIPRPENAELYKRYSALADNTPGVTFLGRLGTYKYYNMDQVVGQALALYQRIEQETAVGTPRAEVTSE